MRDLNIRPSAGREDKHPKNYSDRQISKIADNFRPVNRETTSQDQDLPGNQAAPTGAIAGHRGGINSIGNRIRRF